MNLLQSVLFAGVTATQPIVPQTYYVANLSETDGAKCGEYISITPMPVYNNIQRPISYDVVEPTISVDVTEE
jgi:hypothetical protein